MQQQSRLLLVLTLLAFFVWMFVIMWEFECFCLVSSTEDVKHEKIWMLAAQQVWLLSSRLGAPCIRRHWLLQRWDSEANHPWITSFGSSHGGFTTHTGTLNLHLNTNSFTINSLFLLITVYLIEYLNKVSTVTTQLYDINPIRSQFDPKTRKYTNEWKSEQSSPNEEDFYHLISAVRKMTSFELVLPSKMNFFVLQVVKRVEKSSRCYSS